MQLDARQSQTTFNLLDGVALNNKQTLEQRCLFESFIVIKWNKTLGKHKATAF